MIDLMRKIYAGLTKTGWLISLIIFCVHMYSDQENQLEYEVKLDYLIQVLRMNV